MSGPTAGWSRIRRLAWVAAAGMIAAGCASLGVRTDYDRDVAFGGFRSYAWVDSTKVVRDHEGGRFLERRVRRAVDRGLGERGFVADSEGDPDFLVTAFVIGPTPEERRWRYWPTAPCGQVVSISIAVGYPYGYGRPNRPWPWRSPYYRYPWGYACGYRIGFGYLWIPVYETPGDRLAGTLVIDILDAETRDLIWRGSAEGAVLTYAGESVSQEELDEVATRILREFPPGRR